MTDQSSAAQAAEQAIKAAIRKAYDDGYNDAKMAPDNCSTYCAERAVRLDSAALLSKLRAPVADERADDTLMQVYDAFGIGVLARSPSTLMACLGNVIRRAHRLSQVESVLSVPTPPEPEDDGIWGEESLLRWGADEKGYAEHFKAALAEWSRRAALASAPVAGEEQSEVAKLAEELSDFASDMAYEANQEMDQDKTSRAALIERGERALRGFVDAAPQASEAVRDGKWQMLSELHLHALMFAYNEGYRKAYDGRVFPNPFSENGSQAAAWQLGTDDGTEARAALSAQPEQS
ncbi:hypothetical protein [Achromobacter aegrifaciens]|uniref:Uncharacterized protein n=1 Tax=Achromobacter aegrifaciens TaxID=1287736 RepID=A0ABU2DMB8_ACHAE|nr:hypothetical protein [Achromobacter aegrifaciens]MDR7949173.1 hypothetical protein [Achromobacter aegrifaciens]